MTGLGRRPLLGLGLLAAAGAGPARAGNITEGGLAQAGRSARLTLVVEGEQRWSLRAQDDPPVPYLIEDRVIVSGENLVDAQATFDQRTSEPVVSFRFDAKGAPMR